MKTSIRQPESDLTPSSWELAAETIAVKIRWFGLLLGYGLAKLSESPVNRTALYGLLTVGLVFTLLDTWFSWKKKIFLGQYPLIVSFMEALFIGLLCFFDAGLNSTFRYYYILSLICCAIRHPSWVTVITCAFHCLSYTILYGSVGNRDNPLKDLVLLIVILIWVTWASNSLATLLKLVGVRLIQLNRTLKDNQAELEERIAERTRQLQEAQAHLIHEEKMAAFGLVAAGIAHEVGNPLTSISSMVQMLQKHENDQYTQNKLSLVNGQLQRIRSILRELIEFSRPASSIRTRFTLTEVLDEALNIAKYYKRTRGRVATPPIPIDLPPLFGVRDQLVQVFLNLLLNAIDATSREEAIGVEVKLLDSSWIEVSVRDTGVGIQPDDAARIFKPYFTTKKHGTGLGLFVTRKLVQEHGGTIAFESNPGQGTTFRVRLPLTTIRQDPTNPEPVESPPQSIPQLETSPW